MFRLNETFYRSVGTVSLKQDQCSVSRSTDVSCIILDKTKTTERTAQGLTLLQFSQVRWLLPLPVRSSSSHRCSGGSRCSSPSPTSPQTALLVCLCPRGLLWDVTAGLRDKWVFHLRSVENSLGGGVPTLSAPSVNCFPPVRLISC